MIQKHTTTKPMETKKQTAVEWLFLMINNPISDQEFAKKLLEQAKAMEKEQMKNAVLDEVWDNENMKKKFADRFEQYYNETYNK